jgi:hypothetical protein
MFRRGDYTGEDLMSGRADYIGEDLKPHPVGVPVSNHYRYLTPGIENSSLV